MVRLGNVTALMSLKSRLALARLALHVRADQADVPTLAPVLAAGVDLLVLGGSGDDAVDVDTLTSFRSVHGSSTLLLATDNGDAATQASADVVHIARPGWKMWGSYPRGHQWSLLGRGARDARTVRSPGDDWDYLFVGPLDLAQTDSRVLREAVPAQPAFSAEALPWFALGAFTPDSARTVVTAGVRRIALTPEALEAQDAVAAVQQIRAVLDAAWQADPAAAPYTAGAFRL